MRRSISVLVIEDNPHDAGSVTRALKKSTRVAFQVGIASTLYDGLAALVETSHDAVLLDLGLPDSQGVDAVRQIVDVSVETAVIVLTGFDDDPTALAALQQGAQDYLPKGIFDPDTLTRALLYSVERLRLRRELEQINGELEQRVNERTAQLEEFVTGIAHELTQPLQAMIGFSSAACSIIETSQTDNELAELVHDISAQASHAGALITRFRQLIRHQDVATENTSINKAIRTACQLYERFFKEQGVVVTLELSIDELVVQADRTAIHQVTLNLLRNALQALTTVETKTITIKSYTAGDQLGVFEITDSGTGVDNSLRESLFDAFATTRDEGLGLGLAICKTIVKRHHGSIEHHDHQPCGSTFRVSIPLSIDNGNQ